MKNGRRIGADFEREIVRRLRERFGWTENECYRGAPMQAKGGEVLPDVVCPMPLWLECGKNGSAKPLEKLAQAMVGAKGGASPVAITRKRNGPIEVTMFLPRLAWMDGATYASASNMDPGLPATMLWEPWLDLVDRWWTGVRR